MRTLVVINLLIACLAVRKRRNSQVGAAAASAWATSATKESGPCADHMSSLGYFPRPITFPLICEDGATDLTLTATQNFGWNQPVTIWWDGQDKGTTKLSMPGPIRVTLGAVAPGVHYVSVFAGNWSRAVDFSDVSMVGLGAPCSFDTAPSGGRDASDYMYKGFDVINRLFGEPRDFSELRKQQLDFVSESVGKLPDGSIDSTITGEGIWKWVYEYSQEQPANDQWGQKGILWNESRITPYPEVRMDALPRHSGQTMMIQEPCNALSNLAFHQTSIWISCKGYPFEPEEVASLLAGLNGLAAGSFFLHACSCDTGGKLDTFAIDWLMLQIYQTLVKQVISNAGSHMTQAEVDVIMSFGHNVPAAEDLSRDLTRLFSEKYDHAHWNATVRSIDAPPYMKPIAGFICFVMWSLQGLVGHGTDVILQEVLNSVMDLFGLPDQAFFADVYTPAIRKALGFSNLCSNAVAPVIEYTLKFILTFVEALVFQEQRLDVPDSIRDVLRLLDSLGLTSTLYSDMADSWDLYNGFDCKTRSDHAAWHEKAAHGFVHFLNVAEHYRTSVGC